MSLEIVLSDRLIHPTLILFVLQVTRKNFKFAAKNNLPFFFVSAADGTNVVKVSITGVLIMTLLASMLMADVRACCELHVSQVFQSAIMEARRFKSSGGDVLSDMLELLGDSVR